MQPTLKVEGLRELNKALKDVEKGFEKVLSSGLKKVAEPVAVSARAKAARYGARTAMGIVSGSRSGGAVVRQRRKRTTGFHPAFGPRLMATALIPALEENEDGVVRDVEDLLNEVITKAGW